MKVKKVLVSQPKPSSEKSPYFEIAEKYGVEAFNFASHEQYSFPFYPNYIPDHLDRIALTARLFHDAGYKGVFYPEGIMGNTAWEA